MKPLFLLFTLAIVSNPSHAADAKGSARLASPGLDAVVANQNAILDGPRLSSQKLDCRGLVNGRLHYHERNFDLHTKEHIARLDFKLRFAKELEERLENTEAACRVKMKEGNTFGAQVLVEERMATISDEMRAARPVYLDRWNQFQIEARNR